MEKLNDSILNIEQTEITLNDINRQFNALKQMLEIAKDSSININTKSINNIFWHNQEIEKSLLQINTIIAKCKTDLYDQWLKIKVAINENQEEVWKLVK